MRAVCAQSRACAALAFRMAVAAVDIYARLSWPLARAAMRLASLLTQASTDTMSPLLQLPHFGPARVQLAADAAPNFTAAEQLADLEDAEREAVLAGMPEAAVGDIAAWCNSVPVVDVASCTATVQPDGTAAIVAVRLEALLAEEDDEEEGASNASEVPLARLPHWVASSRPTRWWVAITVPAPTDDDPDATTLRALRLVPLSNAQETVAMRVALTADDKARVEGAAAGAAGKALGLQASLVSDTYRMELKAEVA
uniref:Uncharacterized protein n=1 Tax=Neobodo designis TaxID=312471 RepID=A0A7S1MI60_NEODS|mmetsp:Transcript_40991/g.126573  ORF Transcript_40991/g.126573 Transcript_40991/m.126573 type:complete len:255 (+) Transcript_40991:128-892(+)